jgi:glutamate dehydrogenase
MKKKIDTQQQILLEMMAEQASAVRHAIEAALGGHHEKTRESLEWLFANMPPYFFITMQDETEAILNLAMRLHDVATQRRLTLVDQDDKLIVAHQDVPGSLYDTVKDVHERAITYAELTHSYEPVPGTKWDLEILRFEFEKKRHEDIAESGKAEIEKKTKMAIRQAMKRLYPDFNIKHLDQSMCMLWCNNESYARISPADRIARALWLYEQSTKHNGLYLDLETVEGVLCRCDEYRLLFSVANPPEKGFMTQISDIFRRLSLGVQRSYSLNIRTGSERQFLGTFYIVPRNGAPLQKDSKLFHKLQTELYNTQILSTSTDTYTNFVTLGLMSGEDASLTNAFIAFCHTNLAHNQLDRFSLTRVKNAFHADPEMTLKLIALFKLRFGENASEKQKEYESVLKAVRQSIEGYNTGHKYLDHIRKRIFLTCLSFIQHVLKTNFFVPQKHALAFRLDPQYLKELPRDYTSDLPKGTPFRITFFFGRYGTGYHIGFADIARGGWRTVICQSADSYLTNMNTLFREVFVLAHTQHLKNKDIYEGGSKMTIILDAADCISQEEINHRLVKSQFGLINAFLDIFVTENGKTKARQVIDYYNEDEPIELGPDENLHDDMIETIAKQAEDRGYLLGTGVISSKRAGINHREYGVTSRGVVKFAEIAMRELGIDMQRRPFAVKMTGGTNGDVAGNAIRLLCARFPRVKMLSIVDGAGGVYDPKGISHKELIRLLMKEDVVGISPRTLHAGGFILFRTETRQDKLRTLHRKIFRNKSKIEEQWITTDELHREMEKLMFGVSADLFLPCGGRPETIDETNWDKLFAVDGIPTARIIVEGANSFITPEARKELQSRDVVVLRDASANKCGVIASSYEIIANLLLTEREFLNNKEAYIKSVMEVLDRRAEEEANLIFERFRKYSGSKSYTEISIQISKEINTHYSQLIAFFLEHPDLVEKPAYRKVLLNHLPAFLSQKKRFRSRIKTLPQKVKTAILASEIASSIVYQGGWELPLETKLKRFVTQSLS